MKARRLARRSTLVFLAVTWALSLCAAACGGGSGEGMDADDGVPTRPPLPRVRVARCRLRLRSSGAVPRKTATGTPTYRGSRSTGNRTSTSTRSAKTPPSMPTSVPASTKAPGAASRTRSSMATSPAWTCRSKSIMRAIPGPTRSRWMPPSKVVPGSSKTGTATSWWSSGTLAPCTSSGKPKGWTMAPGRPAPGPTSTSNRTTCGPRAVDLGRRGRASDPPRPGALRRRWPPARSTTPSASRSSGPKTSTSGQPGIRPGEPGDDLPPMGLWLRLKADFDISGYPEEVQVILRAR